MSSTKPRRQRDGAIDLIRGLCLVSMTFGHLAHTSLSTKIIHFHPGFWFDGATGFVLLSGLVLGMVQQSRVTRGTLAAAQRTLLRRTGLIYIVQISTVLLAFAAGAVASATFLLPTLPSWENALPTAARVLLLQVNPPYLDILSMYVILLILALGATALLRRGRLLFLVLGVIALYLAAQLYPRVFTLPRDEDSIVSFNWGTWQLLFLAAFVVGWSWKKHDLARRLQSATAVIFAIGLGAVFMGGGVLVLRTADFPGLAPGFHNLLDKGTLGLGRMVITACVFVVLYWIINRLARGIRRLAVPLEVIGRRSLESYVILTLVQISVPVVLNRTMGESARLAAATLVLMYVWARLHDWRQKTKIPSGRVTGPGAVPVMVPPAQPTGPDLPSPGDGRSVSIGAPAAGHAAPRPDHE
ncbi:MAG: OpgC domain-containing protein [Cryobacterium sp.]